MTTETHHLAWHYDANRDVFVEHVRDFLEGRRTVPVSRTTGSGSEPITFTFSSDLYRVFLTDPDRIWKPYECAVKYGWRGFSRGGRNGIFLLRKQDTGLVRATDHLSPKYEREIAEDLGCEPEEVTQLRKVKIVYHDPSGERVVGVMRNERIVFLGFAHY